VTGRAQTPQEVLEAVRRLEDDLQAIRARARERERDMETLRAGIAADAARERQALVEDMERHLAEGTADMLKGASVELHLGGPVNGLR
jgi:F0F1-type ATP synthase membrane subunit b/b'